MSISMGNIESHRGVRCFSADRSLLHRNAVEDHLKVERTSWRPKGANM